MMLSVGFLLICLCTSAIAGNSSSVLNVTGSNVSTISTRQFPFGIDLPKSIRNKSNDTNHSIVTSLSKVKVTGLGAKHHKAVTATNTIDVSKTSENATLSTNLRNLTQNIKNGGHRSSSNRFLDRLASKVSLVSLTSSKVSDASNKTSSVKNERKSSVNASLIELDAKDATDRINRTIEKRSVYNSTVTDRTSSFFQTLPALLVNTTSNVKSNVTSWAKRLFGTVNDSTTNVTTKKVSRDTTTAELKSLVNAKEFNTSVFSNRDKRRSAAVAISHKGEEKDSLNILSSLRNLTATLPKRDIINLTADIPKAKENISSVINSTSAGIKRDSKTVEVPLKKLQNKSVKPELKVANLTQKILEKTNFSLIGSFSNRIKRHFNNVKPVFKVPSRPAYSKPGSLVPSHPAYSKPIVTTPKSIHAASVPAYGVPPAPSAPAYGVPPAPSAPAYGVPPATAAPAYGVPPATLYGMAPAAPAPAYGTLAAAPIYATPAPTAPTPNYGMASAVSVPAYGMAPAAPTYTTPAPYAPAFDQSTESYYTAPRPSSTTNAPYNLQPTLSPYGISSPPVSYPAQPYGSLPFRPSPTGSPWY